MKTAERRGNAGPWKTRKTKPRFPCLSPRPWKSLRDSHIPTAPTMMPLLNENQSHNYRKEPDIHVRPDFTPSGSFLN